MLVVQCYFAKACCS